MLEQIHGHEVMKMMLAKGCSFTRETLTDAVVEEFGEDARFYSCSQKDMTVSELIDFLQSREKFIGKDDGFNTSPDCTSSNQIGQIAL